MPLKASAFLLHPLPTLPICPQPFPDSVSLQTTPPSAGLPTPAPPAHLSRSPAHCRKTQRLFKGQVHRHRLPFPPASCPPSVIPTPGCHPTHAGTCESPWTPPSSFQICLDQVSWMESTSGYVCNQASAFHLPSAPSPEVSHQHGPRDHHTS